MRRPASTPRWSIGCARLPRRRAARAGQSHGAAAHAAARVVARRAREGVRQFLLRRHDGVLGLGRHDERGHHRHRSAVRLLRRGRGRRGLAQAWARSRRHRVRARQPRPSRSRRRREAVAGALRRARAADGRRLGPARARQPAVEAAPRHRDHRRSEAHARRHDADDVPHAGPHERHGVDADSAARRRRAATSAALWGGTLFNFGPDAARFRAYAESAAKFRDARGGGRRRRAAVESHRLRRHEAEAAGARGARGGCAASVRRRRANRCAAISRSRTNARKPRSRACSNSKKSTTRRAFMRVRLSAESSVGLIASGAALAQQQPDLGLGPSRCADKPYTFDTAEQHGIRVSVVVRGLAHPFSLAFLPNGDALVTERSGGLAPRAQRRERQGRGGDARGAADRRHAGELRAAHERLARPRVASEVRRELARLLHLQQARRGDPGLEPARPPPVRHHGAARQARRHVVDERRKRSSPANGRRAPAARASRSATTACSTCRRARRSA